MIMWVLNEHVVDQILSSNITDMSKGSIPIPTGSYTYTQVFNPSNEEAGYKTGGARLAWRLNFNYVARNGCVYTWVR